MGTLKSIVFKFQTIIPICPQIHIYLSRLILLRHLNAIQFTGFIRFSVISIYKKINLFSFSEIKIKSYLDEDIRTALLNHKTYDHEKTHIARSPGMYLNVFIHTVSILNLQKKIGFDLPSVLNVFTHLYSPNSIHEETPNTVWL